MPSLIQEPSISSSTMKRPMKLIDPSTGLMKCAVCGSTHWANIKPQSGGRFYRGAWQCSSDFCPKNNAERAQVEQPNQITVRLKTVSWQASWLTFSLNLRWQNKARQTRLLPRA
jgi:hypothetical protein